MNQLREDKLILREKVLAAVSRAARRLKNYRVFILNENYRILRTKR